MAVRPGVKYASLALAGAGAAAIVAVWSYREPIARDAIDDYLQKRGVAASYSIRAIETRRQRLEDVRIGDPKNPDLTADWAEIDVGPSLSGLSVKAVRAGGVRVRGRLVNGGLSLGSVDRLLPAPTGEPFSLPDIDLSLEDARMRLDTPYGQLGGKMDGQGNLRSGFEGKLALVAPRLTQTSDCGAGGMSAYGDVSIVGRRPTFKGPVRLTEFRCGAASGKGADLALDASIAENGSDWRGEGRLILATAGAPGVQANGAEARLRFEGSPKKTDADIELAVASLRAQGISASRTRLSGKATLGARGALFKGDVRTARLIPGTYLDAPARQLAAVPEGTPIAPLARQLASALRALSGGAGGHADLEASHVDGSTSLALSDVALASASGASLILPAKDAVRKEGGRLALAGLARFGGGGFPAGTAALNGRSGVINLQPYQSKGARLSLMPVNFAVGPGGVAVSTVATMDGPLAGGRIVGLSAPIRLAKGQTLPAGCLPVSFRRLTVETLDLGATKLTACLTGRDVMMRAPRLSGRFGGAPLRFSADTARYAFAEGRFVVSNAAVQLAGEGPDSHLSANEVSGLSARSGFSGRFVGLTGQLGAVPLRLSGADGPWSFARGKLTAGGSATLSDTAPERRFLPLTADGIQMTLVDGRVAGSAQLREPKSGSDVARVEFRHVLSSGRGSADLTVDGLTFGQRLQPEAITPITLGVVANVNGTIRGEGRIDWDGGNVTSTGAFQTAGLDYAAAFGPVQGMKGEIRFTDLLGFVTAPNQTVQVANINPGIEVWDGLINYRILPDFKVQVEGGRWPFAGGYLILDPTVLDMSTAAARHLTFRVEGVDAARFIAALEFENISATGVYDGVLPMVFDDQGGRIEGGHLEAQGGGTLSYVGQVSNENLGALGSFAFDALRSMKYDRLAISLNGAIDGDVITRISFAGVNQAPVEGGRTKLPIKILGATNMPFIFNVTITAQFRTLFNMARNITDPTGAAKDAIKKYRDQLKYEPKPANPVQARESGPQQ